MESKKGLEVLTLKYLVYWGSLATLGVASILFLGGCDALVADNPACLYDCASTSSYSGGP